MKKKFLFSALILLSSISIIAQTCEWAEGISGYTNEGVFCTACDGTGNIYIAGSYFSRTITFNNGKQLFNLGNGSNLFIAKYTNSGICLWAVSIEGYCKEPNSYNYFNSIVVDDFGNLFLAGYFESDSLIFNKDFLLTNKGSFLTKFNKNGLFQWVEEIGGTGSDNINDICLDDNANIFVAGSYNSRTIIFNDGSLLINKGGSSGFIAKFNSDGKFQWAYNIDGNKDDFAKSIIIDKYDNLYITGYFSSDTLNFNAGKFLINRGSF